MINQRFCGSWCFFSLRSSSSMVVGDERAPVSVLKCQSHLNIQQFSVQFYERIEWRWFVVAMAWRMLQQFIIMNVHRHCISRSHCKYPMLRRANHRIGRGGRWSTDFLFFFFICLCVFIFCLSFRGSTKHVPLRLTVSNLVHIFRITFQERKQFGWITKYMKEEGRQQQQKKCLCLFSFWWNENTSSRKSDSEKKRGEWIKANKRKIIKKSEAHK